MVSIQGLENSTLGFCRNHMLGIGTCTIHVETEGSGALILEVMKGIYLFKLCCQMLNYSVVLITYRNIYDTLSPI